MAKIKKDLIDVDATLVKLRFLMKGFKQEIVINTTLSQVCDFIDILNQNKFKKLSKAEKEMMENKFYVFDDYIKKQTVCINFNEVKAFTVPFFIDDGEEYDFKILEWRN